MTQMEERAADRLTLQMSGAPARRDYELVMMPRIEDAIEHEGRPPILVELEGFRGRRPRALVDELRCDVRRRKDLAEARRWLDFEAAPGAQQLDKEEHA